MPAIMAHRLAQDHDFYTNSILDTPGGKDDDQSLTDPQGRYKDSE